MRHLTRQTEARYRSRDKAINSSRPLCANSGHCLRAWRAGQIDPNRHFGPTLWTLRPRKTIIDANLSEETAMDVGLWLRSLALGQYEAAFRDNEIDGEVLPKLTVEDLKDLGVAVVGHRRKIMSAIEALNAPSHARAEPATGSPMQTSVPADAAERRQLTVMFCDLVGSTAMSARTRSRSDAPDHSRLPGRLFRRGGAL